jgi:hypothetical protein
MTNDQWQPIRATTNQSRSKSQQNIEIVYEKLCEAQHRCNET